MVYYVRSLLLSPPPLPAPSTRILVPTHSSPLPSPWVCTQMCPNCGQRSDDYDSSMVHYNACDVVRVRNVSSPTASGIASSGASGGAGAGAGQGTAPPEEQTRQGKAGVADNAPDPAKSSAAGGEPKQ
ncbi:hypothetical protein JCM10207_006620 [Rhodosporidiobolus poonsookiae]